MLIRSIKGVLMNMIEDVSDDKEGQMALQRAVEKHQSKQKKKENENNGQKTILGKDEKTEVPKYIKEGIEGIKQAAFEGKGAFSNSAKQLNTTVVLSSGKEKNLDLKESFDLVKATSTDEEKKIIEDINLEDQKGVEIMENFNKPTEKYPKRRSPPEEHLVISKSSLQDIDIPKDNLPSMRLMHYSHILFSELSNFSDPNNFTYGNESNFKEKNKNVFTNQIPLDVYLEDVKEWATIKINPYILTLHKFSRIILGKDKSIGGSKTTKLLSFLRSKEAKQKIELTFSDSTHGKVKAKFPLVTFNFLEDKKHIAVFFHPAFYLGVLNVDRRILQNVPSNIFEIIKYVYREKSGKRCVKNRAELILLNYFYRIIQVNNQDKDDHRMSIKNFPFSKSTRAKEKHEIMTWALKTFSDARVNKLIQGFKIKGNIIEFETKKFIGSCGKDTKKDGDNDSHKLIQ